MTELPLSFNDRLLTLAVAAIEHGSAAPAAATAPPADHAAVAAAIASGGDSETKLVVRARRMAVAPSANEALLRSLSIGRLVAAGLLLAALLLGWFTAQAVLGTTDRARPVNVYWLLGGVLLPQTAILVVWLLLATLGPPGVQAISIGGALRAFLARTMSLWMGREPAAAGASTALAIAHGRGPLLRWTLATLTHGAWTAFNLGCLIGVLAVLLLEQHLFCWESTLLSPEHMEGLTRAIAWLPEQLGFPTPSAAMIAASRLDPAHADRFAAQTGDVGAAWSGLLIGSVLVYGLLPRAALLIFSRARLSRARRRYRLDVEHPLLAPAMSSLTPAHGAATPRAGTAWRDLTRETPIASAGSGVGPIVLAGIELPTPAAGWPPIGVPELVDLGRIESREDRATALAMLRDMTQGPRRLVVVVSLASTPDRGLGHCLTELAHAARAPVNVILTGGQACRQRGDTASVSQRIEDWRTLATRAGVTSTSVVELDLDLLTATTSAQLRELLAGTRVPSDERAVEPAVSTERHLEAAFGIIEQHAASWTVAPGLAQQAELSRQIAALYGGPLRNRSGGRGPAAGSAAGPTANHGDRFARTVRSLGIDRPITLAEVLSSAKSSADRMTRYLPVSFRSTPRWIAAGAVAGALGCVAAATLAAPVAIAAMPMWTGVGAAIGAFTSISRELSSSRGGRVPTETPAAHDERVGIAQAVRAAALWAIVLEFQGRGETTIARLLEGAFAEPDPLELQIERARQVGGDSGDALAGDVELDCRPEEVHRALEEVRHRLDLTLIEIGRSANEGAPSA